MDTKNTYLHVIQEYTLMLIEGNEIKCTFRLRLFSKRLRVHI